MKKRLVISMALAACLAGVPVCVYGAEAAEESVAAEALEAEDKEAAADTDTAALSEDIYDFQADINGVVYQFPMTYEEFIAQGWEPGKNEDPAAMVETNSYGMVTFNKGEDSVMADVINFGINAMPINECLVGGIELDGNFSFDIAANTVTLAKGITMGQSDADDIKAAYGEPSDTYEGDLYVQLTYEIDSYQQVEFQVYKEENVLKSVDIRNFSEPEDFDKGEVSTETPDIVADYKAPQTLGTDFMEPVVEFCGDLYQLPCPVTALEANGWTMKDVAEDAFVAGGDIEFIEMMKDNQTLSFSVYNLTENAVTVENCFVKELGAATYDPETITIKLSGDITLGADRSELIAMAEEKGYLTEDSDGYLTVYKTKDTKLDTSVQFWFNEDESADAAASVIYYNEVVAE